MSEWANGRDSLIRPFVFLLCREITSLNQYKGKF